MSDELKGWSCIGKKSDCGTVLAILFLVSFISLLINYGLFFLLILCQAGIIFFDAIKIREENNNIGPNPIVFGILTIFLWVIFVPYYIIYRNRFVNEEINPHKTITAIPEKNDAKPKVLETPNKPNSLNIIHTETQIKPKEVVQRGSGFENNEITRYNLHNDLLIKPVEKFFEGPINVSNNNSQTNDSIHSSDNFIGRPRRDFRDSIYYKVNLSNDRASLLRPKTPSVKKTTYSETNYSPQINKTITTKETPSLKSDVLTWAGDLKEIQIHNYLILNPLIYWTSNPSENTEASCINLNLQIGTPKSEAKGSLGYWPRFLNISNDQRANYLLWLSSGRSAELSDIGYAFLFFYGLEYRAIIENKDIPIIIQEVNSLLKRYTFSGSFNSYLTSFIAYISAKNLSSINEENFTQFFPNLLDLSHDQVLVLLAWYTENSKPIDWEIAYSLANTIQDTPKSIITQKLSPQFKRLFEIKFKSQYPNGLILKPSARNYLMKYRPASPSLLPYYQSYSSDRELESVEITNPLGKKSQFKKIFIIWSESIEELNNASRKIGKGEQELTAQAYQSLPDILKKEIDHPDKSKWDLIFTSSNYDGEATYVSISSLATLNQIEKRDRLTPTQSRQLFNIAREIGYILIPDPRITGTPYRWDDNVVMYPLPDKSIFTSEAYPSTAFILELGMSIALVDGKISLEEQDHLERFIFGSSELTQLDVDCLKLYQKILNTSPPSLERLGTRLKEHLNENNRIIVAEYLRDMASADGYLEPNEYKSLNKIFKYMGLGKDDIQTLFPFDLPKSSSEQPIQISRSLSMREGEVIGQPAPIEPSFVLNLELVDDKLNKTLKVQKILHDSLTSEENNIEDGSNLSNNDSDLSNNIEIDSPKTLDNSSNINNHGLHPKYIPFLKDVTKPSSLSKMELQNICRNNRFMLDATIEEINTWSDENYGDYLFENTDEEEISLNFDIRAKILEDII
ncbi:TerB N-terminal domain-containing protein [Methanospirillum stamsii]|uniref:Tellurite resistance protein TerB n=1 Tax=Methanospirillum stamsii TaxID=1277351 RepID=A0A2V2N5Y7_9EURY|nr:TerB N-terminal domain-containing protein [Methanospirillum stamsii]PWR73146.1 hypothetical protein DLD82_11250 [Methanospirillum stamsii]